jgi:hypothetical protein
MTVTILEYIQILRSHAGLSSKVHAAKRHFPVLCSFWLCHHIFFYRICYNHVASAVTCGEIIQFGFIVEVLKVQLRERRITHNLSIKSCGRTNSIRNLRLLQSASGIRQLEGSLVNVAFFVRALGKDGRVGTTGFCVIRHSGRSILRKEDFLCFLSHGDGGELHKLF